jgi:CRISPR-associated exonuclease Cas4
VEVDDLIPISALQHMAFCERQAALIHVERIWKDDLSTTKGHLVHERSDSAGATKQRGLRVARAMPLTSQRFGLIGFADMVELHAAPDTPRGVRPVPVEVKKGTTKNLRADQVQLCAQALCLEEAFSVEVPEAWIYYAGSHRRTLIAVDQCLRQDTIATIERFRVMRGQAKLPPPVVPAKVCARCSLETLCLPRAAREPERARRHLLRLAEGHE